MNMPSHANTTAGHSHDAWRFAAAVLTAAAVLPTAAGASQLQSASPSGPHTLGGLTGPQRTLACVLSPLGAVYCYGDDEPPNSPPAPLPDDDYEPAPLPDDDFEPAPLPDDDFEPAPLPDDDYELVAECTTVATAEEVENSDCGSVHADAVAEVFKMACDGKGDMVLEDIEEIFMAEDAVAFAQATATALVKCMSDDEDAFLCASISISSEAFANTTVAAHVSATATALDGCACMGDSLSSFITAEAFVSLVAEATATATASACISGRGRVVQEVYESCTTTVFARVFARAAARAILEGECLDSEASLELLAEANAMNVTASSTCGGMAAVTVDGVPVPIDT